MRHDNGYLINAPRVISEVVEGELVMINLDRGTYYSVGGAGAVIWQLVERGLSHGEIVTAACATFAADPAEIEAAVDAFIGRLLAEDLITPTDQPPVPGAAVTAKPEKRGAFEPPVLEVYSDMVDILLLDPVHDVSEAGWPKPKSATDPTSV